jgi:integrase/recombinase XerD
VREPAVLGTALSYALLRWWRFLLAVDVAWDRAGPAEGRDYVLWLGQANKPIAGKRTRSAATAGRVNQVTRKPYPGDKYQPRTIRNGNAVVRAFYEFWIEQGTGPLLNPMPLQRTGERASVHHNPLRPFPAQGRLRYNPPVPKRTPRMMPDQEWDAFFAALRSDRDRAIVSLAVSTGARAGELIGMTGADVDWGNQLICVRRKGTGAPQWLAASQESFVWLRLYLAAIGDLQPGDPLWWTLRRYGADAACRDRVELNYDALRAVFRRANEQLGTNWSMHDLRHSCAVRMARDEHLTLRDVQVTLGHAHLSTSEIYLVEGTDQVLSRIHQHHIDRQRKAGPLSGPPLPAAGYNPADLEILFGRGRGQ